jgi:oligopeptide/dipeptide ABC transporter ATP-binding protein
MSGSHLIESHPSEGDFIRVQDLHRAYPVRRGLFSRPRLSRAVEGVSFGVEKGGTFGLVGESGSGKSTIAKVLLAAEPATQGKVSIDGIALDALDKTARRRLHLTVQPVLQDPYGALSPLMRIADIVNEPMRAQALPGGAARTRRLHELVEIVGLNTNILQRFPHELSGGQRQRVAIARALGTKPQALILDEPVSALDVSVQAQILNLLKDLQATFGLSYVLISHDLAVVAYMSTRIGVLYKGRFMEIGSRDDVVRRARHPYTHALIASSAVDLDATDIVGNRTQPPALVHEGCRFESRCPHAVARCRHEVPALRSLTATHRVACHFDLPAVDAAEVA